MERPLPSTGQRQRCHVAPSYATWAVAAGHIVSLPFASRGADDKEEGTKEGAEYKSGERGEGRTRRTTKVAEEADGKGYRGGRRQRLPRRQTATVAEEADGKGCRGGRRQRLR